MREYLNKFDSKARKCIKFGYSESSKGYIVYNIETQIIEGLIHVKFDDKIDPKMSKPDENFADFEIICSDSIKIKIPEIKTPRSRTMDTLN